MSNAPQSEAEYAIQLDQWWKYHEDRKAAWETLAAMRRAGVEIRSWLAGRRWADMYRNDAMQEWIGDLSPAAQVLAHECRGCLRWALLGPDFERPSTAIAQTFARGLVALRFAFYQSVADLAHRWVADRPKLRPADRAELVTEAEIECLHSIETWWPDHGRFSTWLYSRLQGTYTARLRELKKAPIPDLAVTLSGLNMHAGDGDDADDPSAFRGGGRSETQSDPWTAVHEHRDATRCAVRAQASLGGVPITLQVCEIHAPLLTRKWRGHVKIGKHSRKHDCDVCAMKASDAGAARLHTLVIGGLIKPETPGKPRGRRRVVPLAAPAPAQVCA